MRDISGATRLDRLAWLQLGLYLGAAGIGVTLALMSRVMKLQAEQSTERALFAIGGGVALALHGLALATLELFLIADISR